MPIDRYARQRQVQQVGATGQLRLQRLTVVVPPGTTGDIEALYLERAGVQVERCQRAPAPRLPFEDLFEHEGSRVLARGAHAALSALREGLGLTTPSAGKKARLL